MLGFLKDTLLEFHHNNKEAKKEIVRATRTKPYVGQTFPVTKATYITLRNFGYVQTNFEGWSSSFDNNLKFEVLEGNQFRIKEEG